MSLRTVMGRIMAWRAELQLGGWLLFFWWMLAKGYDGLYLAKLQSQILWAGCITLTLAWLAGLLAREKSAPEPSTAPWRDLLATLGYFAPILLFAIVGTTTLNLTEDNYGSLNVRVQTPTARPFEEMNFEFPPESGYFPVTLVDLYTQQTINEQVPVETLGRLHRIPQEAAQRHMPGFQGEMLMLYRHAISCCAADATPVGVILQGDEQTLTQLESVTEGQWLTIQGRVRESDHNGQVFLMQIEKWAPSAAPEAPYLSWLTGLNG
ncbi:hypothetical protein [Magnetofaba australis]|nr:hypothetical protein [Magnetofaba australis]